MVNFFAGHSHCTRLGQDISDYRDISASVIQGSAIGPASFVVNASDLRPLTKENRLMKYADDTYLIVPAMNAASCTKELDNIQSWATANNLTLNRAKSKLIIFANPHRRRVHSDLDLLATTDGIPRVNAIKILGVTITDNFSMTDHVAAVITSCAQNLYALRTLRAHGMPSTELQSVFQATAIAKLTYASPAWWGFTSAEDRTRLEAFVRRAVKAGFHSVTAPTLSDMCELADTRLLKSVDSNTDHVLYYLLPPKRENLYNTRSRVHNYVVPQRTNRLCDSNWITRVMFKNCY